MQDRIIANNQAVTVGVTNRGANMEQETKHLVHVRRRVTSDVLTMTEASTASAIRSMQQHFVVRGPCNYFALHGSLRGNPVYCFVNSNEVKFIGPINGVMYPVYDYWNPGNIGSTVFRIPTNENYSFCCAVWFPGITTGYQDAISFEYGYLPDTVENRFIPQLDIPIR